MAIKGKGRTRGRRAVAAPPRRAVVVRKPPIWQRRWVWLVAGLVAVAGILVAVYAAVHSRSVSARTAREKTAATRYINLFRANLPADRTPIPPDAIVIFSTVQDDIDSFKDVTAAQAEKKGTELAAAAAKSADGLEKVAVARVVPEEFAADRAELNEAQFLIVHAYRLYVPVGGLMQAAGKASGAERQALLDQAQLLMNQAGALFDRGYVKIVRMATRLGIPIRTAFQPAPNTPGGNATPTPTPTVSSSSGPSPSASP